MSFCLDHQAVFERINDCLKLAVHLELGEGRVLVDLSPDQYVGAAPDMGALESAVSVERQMVL